MYKLIQVVGLNSFNFHNIWQVKKSLIQNCQFFAVNFCFFWYAFMKLNTCKFWTSGRGLPFYELIGPVWLSFEWLQVDLLQIQENNVVWIMKSSLCFKFHPPIHAYWCLTCMSAFLCINIEPGYLKFKSLTFCELEISILDQNFFCCIFSRIMASLTTFWFTLLQVDAALIATGRAPFTQGLGLENVWLLRY